MIKGKALRRAVATSQAERIFENIPLLIDKTEFVSPEIAHEYLKKNKYNRPTNWNRVEQYCDEITAGKWKLTPQGIVFDTEGNLINGQNRLWAIVYSGIGIHIRVSRGSPPEVATLLDRGAPQSARDLATRKTLKRHSPIEASVARAVIAANGKLRPSTDELAERIAVNSDKVKQLLEKTKGTKKSKPVLMILGAICALDKINAAKHIESLSRDLENELKPLTPTQCWGKGAVFLFAMEKAKQIVDAAT